jgi:DNA/RNA-binding domain of Phe-tRNA-synthetase-like protein
MKFSVSKEVFEKIDNVFFGVVLAKGISNDENIEITKFLKNSIASTEVKFQDKKVKELEEIVYYREAFIKLGINPNKFMSSIEAMITRVAKKKGLPNINSIVDLGNAISLKYIVPLGAHDIDIAEDDICLRFSSNGDIFIPFGESEAECLEEKELIYTVGNNVKTRRWIWRQSEQGKITKESKNIFFPIDGFKDKNYNNVISARDELAELLRKNFNCKVKVDIVDINNTEFEF